MEVKKKTFLENLRMKTKLPKLKTPGKKTPKKQGKKLAYRRSLSVPDLRFASGDMSSIDGGILTGASDGIFFGASPGQSDTDSIASGSISGHIFTDQLSDTVEASYRSACKEEGVLLEVEEVDTPTANEIYAQIDKPSKLNKDDLLVTPDVTCLPVPAPRRIAISIPTQTMSVDRENPPPETLYNPEKTQPDSGPGISRTRRGGVASIVRTNSFEDEKSPRIEKRAPSVERRKLSSNRRAIRRYDAWSQPADDPVDSAEGASLDHAGGSSSEERVAVPWTDSDPDREVLSPFFSEVLSMEDCQQLDEATEESIEVSEQGDFFDEAIRDPADCTFPTPLPLQRYRLNIDLKEGRNLVIRDKRSGTSDPYVKFKLEGKNFYKSKVVYKNLNPRWNESFSHPLRDREHVVEVRVYDKNRTTDEFMGSGTIALKSLELYKTIQMELPLSDPKSKESDMGVIIVDVCIMFRDATIKRSPAPRWPVKKNKAQGGQQQNEVQTKGQRSAEAQKNQLKNQVWTRVISITLVEGHDLPQHGDHDIFVRFRLGDQKYRSKNLCIQANPQWREQFDFNYYEDSQEPLQVEVFCKRGRKCEESWGMFESDLSRRPLNERQLFTHVLDPGKGRLVFLVNQKPCTGVSISDITAAPLEQPDEKDTIMDKYSLRNLHKGMAEVGFLQIKVIRATDLTAADLNGKSDPFCVIELGNSRLQTQIKYKTLNPEWNTVITLPIKDIHDVVELHVFDDNIDKAPNLLGKVAIPLLTVQNGQQICRQLKKEDLVRASKGTITLVMDVIYNKVRAGLKSFQPKEEKYTEEIPKFAKKVLAQNIYRVRRITTAVLYTLQYIKSCFQWESTQRSLIAFLVFLLTVWYFEPFMLPLFLLLLIGWNYFQQGSGKAGSTNLDLVNMSMADDEEEDEKEPGKQGLMDKIHMVQEVILTIQTILGDIASIGESTKNMFNWSVPFMSCLTCLLLFLATVGLYYIPLRLIVLLWGANKFTAKLRNPYAIDNNEILDFLKRVPSDVQKVQYSELRAPAVQGPPRRRK